MIPAAKVFRNLTRLHLAWEIEEWGWDIGDHSYGKPILWDPEYAKLKIGRFCSIGPNVTIVLGNHRTDLVSTYPFKTLESFWPEAAEGVEDHESRGDTVIHHDVWIGANATILSGAEISCGAVVAAGSLVRGYVPLYAIIAGNPAKIIRMRFEETTIARLLKLAWWNWDELKLRALLPVMTQGDVNAFMDRAEAE